MTSETSTTPRTGSDDPGRTDDGGRDGPGAGPGDRPITVDVFHDTVCPWCRIGVAALGRALDGWDGPPVELRWHPFPLDPETPAEGRPFRETLAARMGHDPTPALERVSEAGRTVGVAFDWSAVRRSPNSVMSHLLYAILPDDRQTSMVERIGRAHFEEGRDIGDLATLTDLARETGVDPDLAARALREPRLHAAIASEVAQAVELGVSGVPLFILDDRIPVSGAQAPGVFRAALDQAVADRSGTV